MSSMIEQVKQAEAQAAKLRQEAQASARDLIAKVQLEVKEQKSCGAEEERGLLRDALKLAETDGEALKGDIISKRKQEADAACSEAEKKIPEAVAYLLGKVVSSV